MLRSYINFNKKLSPLYIILFLSLILGVILTWDRNTYIQDMVFVILQIWAILSIPNIIYLIMKRKQKGSSNGFLRIMLFIPLPYIGLALIMGLIVVYR